LISFFLFVFLRCQSSTARESRAPRRTPDRRRAATGAPAFARGHDKSAAAMIVLHAATTRPRLPRIHRNSPLLQLRSVRSAATSRCAPRHDWRCRRRHRQPCLRLSLSVPSTARRWCTRKSRRLPARQLSRPTCHGGRDGVDSRACRPAKSGVQPPPRKAARIASNSATPQPIPTNLCRHRASELVLLRSRHRER